MTKRSDRFGQNLAQRSWAQNCSLATSLKPFKNWRFQPFKIITERYTGCFRICVKKFRIRFFGSKQKNPIKEGPEIVRLGYTAKIRFFF